MKIKSHGHISLLPKKVLVFFQKKKRISSWLAVPGLIFGSILLFFVLFNYGSYLQQTARTRHLKQMMVDLSKFDLSFLKNYAEGQTTALGEINIDIKFKHLLRLQYLREQALKEEFIDPAFKNEEFPAKLTHNGQSHRVKISLTGKVARAHLGNPSKWSFQVKVRGDDTILGMKRFGLLIPTARGNLTDWIGFKLLQNRGLIGLRVDYQTVSINGKYAGIFYLEERFDKHLLENNRLREGIIFKIEQTLRPYREAKLIQNPDTRAQLLLLKRMWLDLVAGNLAPQQFFDMEKMAKLFAFSDLVNTQHQLSKENIRFYFNPITNLVEPIAREFENLTRRDPSALKMFLDKPDMYTVHFWHRQESIIGLIYNNYEFQRLYIREAQLLSQKEFLDNFFAEIELDLQLMRQKMYRSWPFYKTPTQILYANQEKMREALFPDTNELIAHFDQKEDDQLKLHLRNQHHFPLEVAYLSWRDSIFFYPDEETIIASKTSINPAVSTVFSFQIPAGVSISDIYLSELKVHYNLLGLPPGKKAVEVYPLALENRLEFVDSDLPRKSNYRSFDFIQENADQKTVFIPSGNWSLSRDLIIPPQKLLQIEAGAKIDLVNHAKIISYSPVSCLGNKENPIIITSSDSTGEGLKIINTSQWSELSYTNFEKISGPEHSDQQLTGAIVFYKSPVAIHTANFSDNKKGENFLKIIGSEFLMEKVGFKNINATAFECHNCRGTINNSSFIRMGKNAVHLSGIQASLVVKRVFMNHIGSDGISATENSSLDARWVDIRNANTGIAGGDQVQITISDVQLWNTKVGMNLLQKSPQYGPVRILADRVNMQQLEYPYLLEQNSQLIIDGNSMAPTSLNTIKKEEKL